MKKQSGKKLVEILAVDQPAEPVEVKAAYPEMPAAKYFDGPLQWRDRIREIDSIVESLKAERAGLVAKLESEGLQLLQGKASGSVQPVEDMSDWRNWKVGDLLYWEGKSAGWYVEGCSYEIVSIEDRQFVIDDKSGKKDHYWDFQMAAENFKWQSRPSA